MNRTAEILLLAAGIALGAATARAADAPAEPAKLYVAIFDLASSPAGDGKKLADTLRVRLRRHEQYEVIDRLTTAEASGALPIGTDPKKVSDLMANKIGVNIALYGSLESYGSGRTAKIRCIDLTDPKKPGGWMKEFSDDSERWQAVISKAVIENVRNEGEWQPPEYGDEKEPTAWGKPLNVNGDFEAARGGWEAPDNVSARYVADPRGKGKILKITTDLERAPWIEYRRKLIFGQADPARPPKIGKDSSYASVAGMEGVHYRSDWIDATPGQRYWLIADVNGKTAGIFFPKIFVKGYMDYTDHADDLPERTLEELKLTARQFADLPAAKQKALLSEDIKNHPDRYRRECFRWFLSCRNEEGGWKHFGAPWPPRGGLPKVVQWLRIEIYSYWPPGDYLYDNVQMYKDPSQKAPLPEEAPRSKYFKGGGLQPQPE